jgi:hypothetical protein
MLTLLLEVAVQMGDANAYISLIFGVEMVDDGGHHHRLACSGHVLTKQSLFALVKPLLEYVQVKQPFPSPFLSPINEVTLLITVVNWSKPIMDFCTSIISLILDTSNSILDRLSKTTCYG